MKILRRFALVAAVGVALTMNPALAQERPKKVGKILSVVGGKVETDARSNQGKWYQAYPSMATFITEHLKTDQKAQATVEFFVGGQAVVAPESVVVISSPDKLENVDEANVKLVKGTMWAKIEGIDKEKEKLQIETAGGTMGIEGTEFFVSSEGDDTTVTMIEGKVTVQDKQGQSQTITGGQKATFGSDALQVASFITGGGIWEIREAAISELPPGVRGFARSAMNRVLYRLPLHELRQAGRVVAFIQDPGNALNAEVEREARRVWARGPGRSVGVGPFSTGGAPFPEPKPVKNLRVEGERPEFSWENAPGADMYNLVLSQDPEGQQVVWATTTDQTEKFVYPAYGPTLAPGTYYWFLTPMEGSDVKNAEPKTWSITGISPKSLAANRSFRVSNEVKPQYGEVAGIEVSDSGKVTWEEFPKADRYRVLIAYDDQMDTVLSGAEVTETEFNPDRDDLRPIGPGDYFVTVEAIDAFGFTMAKSEPVAFTK